MGMHEHNLIVENFLTCMTYTTIYLLIFLKHLSRFGDFGWSTYVLKNMKTNLFIVVSYFVQFFDNGRRAGPFLVEVRARETAGGHCISPAKRRGS